MSRKKTSKTANSQKIKREGDPIPWRYCLLTLCCGLILVGGFFFAARQHFSSIDYGIKNSQLKKQKDELETAQRQLLIAKESALSPASIKRVAKEYGFTEIAETVQTLYTKNTEKPKTEKVSDTKDTEKNQIVNTRKDEKDTEKKTSETVNSKNKKGLQK